MKWICGVGMQLLNFLFQTFTLQRLAALQTLSLCSAYFKLVCNTDVYIFKRGLCFNMPPYTQEYSCIYNKSRIMAVDLCQSLCLPRETKHSALHFSSNCPSSLALAWTVLSLEERPLSPKWKWTAASCPEELALLCWAMHPCSCWLWSSGESTVWKRSKRKRSEAIFVTRERPPLNGGGWMPVTAAQGEFWRTLSDILH